MFKRENVYNLSALLAKWMTEHQPVKNRISVDYNIKDAQNITKLSESQILKVIQPFNLIVSSHFRIRFFMKSFLVYTTKRHSLTI